ncbi:unnamed protein product [Hyaloperonospora brassicae]|uniref:RxLR effector candidate protein n=1 Tax=Hyaloperonospora brassicae TaxID=162125 RepID=A0AAV0TJE3_HYABA|nr:unnamed protein product [Hyaloperonospora brassicae]
MYSGLLPSALPVRSTPSNEVTTWDEDAVSVASAFFSVVGDVDDNAQRTMMLMALLMTTTTPLLTPPLPPLPTRAMFVSGPPGRQI